MILTALMHDLGKTYKKIWTDSKTHPGKTSYIGHEFESAKLVEHIFRYLKIEPYIKEVALLSSLHMRGHKLNEGGEKALRKFIRICGEKSLNWIDLFNLSLADSQAKSTVKDPKITQQYQELEIRLQNALQSLTTPQHDKAYTKPILNGNEICQILNIQPGPIIKEIIDYLKDLRDEFPNITKEEAANKIKEKFSMTPTNPTNPTKTAKINKTFIITKIY
jgi:poly(A) polymerase